MTLLTNAQRLSVFVLALVYTTLMLGALATPTPAFAKDTGPYYRAELAQPAAENRMVSAGTVWNCRENVCVAAKAQSRPVRICRGLQRSFGDVKAFAVEGREIEASQLEWCNK